MTDIILEQRWRDSFCAALAGRLSQPLSILCQGSRLTLEGAAPADIAMALSVGAFLPREGELLLGIAARELTMFLPEQRRQLGTMAAAIARRDGERGPLYSGPYRLERLSRAMEEAMAGGRLDFSGFCRFRLPGYEGYLRFLLTLAGDELLAREEERDYLALLRAASRPVARGPELHLFFPQPGLFRLAQREGGRLQELEGGRCQEGGSLLAALLLNRPARLLLHQTAFAPPRLLARLTQVFGSRLSLLP